jgi:hypothetical protein
MIYVNTVPFHVCIQMSQCDYFTVANTSMEI